MIFALGFLAASLCALLFVPILNTRAMRLARRRLDGLFPMTITEITAERDALRADFAVAQRRMERRVEQAQSRRHADMAALGSRTMEAATLARQVEERDAALAARQAEIAQALDRITGLDRDLTGLRADQETGLAALDALEGAYQRAIRDIRATRSERDSVRRELFDALSTDEGSAAHALSKDREARVAEAAKAAADLQALRAQHDTMLAERDGLRAELRQAELSLARALDEGREGEAPDIEELRRRISEVADALLRREHLPSIEAFPMKAGARS